MGVGSAFGDCDCKHYPGGCKISWPADDHKACKCHNNGWAHCWGEEIDCTHMGYPWDVKMKEWCDQPDTSVQSCVLGGGDCGGYPADDGDCDCTTGKGGICKISRAAQKWTACRCEDRPFEGCDGWPVRCQ